ncbi:MAG TPA: succinyl-diaminopimelate desuccinylase [Acidimicrobiales bacterium]
MSDTDLLALTRELVEIPSVSHGEGAMADRVAAALADCGWLAVERIGDNVLARTDLGRPRRVVLAGHLDTVPPARAEVVDDGEVLWGVGAADMKGGLAVMLDLARTLRRPATDITWCFYAREEVARAESGLMQLWSERPDLLEADVAILGEPTGGRVEAGCQGTLRAVVELGGVRAHTARPFTGRNAIHRLAPVLARVAEWEGRSVVLSGCEYVEQLQAVGVTGGVGGNVVPDRVSLSVNYRFAPDRATSDAIGVLDRVFEDLLSTQLSDSLRVVDAADGAPPSLEDPLLERLVAATGEPPRAKVGWTDVASFWAHGVPAANFGPGDPLLAHHPDERVERAALERARAVLSALLDPAA